MGLGMVMYVTISCNSHGIEHVGTLWSAIYKLQTYYILLYDVHCIFHSAEIILSGRHFRLFVNPNCT